MDNNTKVIEGQGTEEMTSYLACGLIEGFEESDNFNELDAWAYLIRTGICWSLQGFYGRAAQELIDRGVISKGGNIL